MHMNTLIAIGSDLWFEGTQEGGTLNFKTGVGQENLLFQVGISRASLEDCYRKLGKSIIEWKIRDCSLALFGDQEELRLHFCALEQPRHSAEHVLRGRELRIFRYAIYALASRFTSLLN